MRTREGNVPPPCWNPHPRKWHHHGGSGTCAPHGGQLVVESHRAQSRTGGKGPAAYGVLAELRLRGTPPGTASSTASNRSNELLHRDGISFPCDASRYRISAQRRSLYKHERHAAQRAQWTAAASLAWAAKAKLRRNSRSR